MSVHSLLHKVPHRLDRNKDVLEPAGRVGTDHGEERSRPLWRAKEGCLSISLSQEHSSPLRVLVGKFWLESCLPEAMGCVVLHSFRIPSARLVSVCIPVRLRSSAGPFTK